MTTDSETTTGGTQPSTSSLGGDTTTPSSDNASNVTMTPAKLESFKKALHDIFRENREASHMEIPDVCFIYLICVICVVKFKRNIRGITLLLSLI